MFDWFKKKKKVVEEVTEEVAATEEAVVTQEAAVTEEVSVTQEAAVTEKVSVTEEVAITEEVAVSEETTITEETVVTEETAIAEETKESVVTVGATVTNETNISEVVAENVEADDTADKTESVSEVSENTEESSEQPVEKPVKLGWFARLKQGLSKTRDNIVSSMDSLFSGAEKIDDDFYEELEEVLILGDIGVHTTETILEKLKEQVKHEHIKKRTECREFLIKSIKEEMASSDTAYEFEKRQSVVFVIGVNGVGKTTSIGKLASHLKSQGKRVMLAAADTFRAAAGSQLEEWSHRAGVEMIGGVEGQDPSSVLFDAVTAAKARNVDVLLVDTAGRLHNKKNLMEELKKMNRIIDKAYPDCHRENLIVLDASTGQNAMMQAKEFGEVADLTGIILTKMDGTAKGGIAIAITSELKIPVKYIGVGEKIEDLQKFDAESFVDALFDTGASDEDKE